jgi:hypothetical protein
MVYNVLISLLCFHLYPIDGVEILQDVYRHRMKSVLMTNINHHSYMHTEIRTMIAEHTWAVKVYGFGFIIFLIHLVTNYFKYVNVRK